MAETFARFGNAPTKIISVILRIAEFPVVYVPNPDLTKSRCQSPLGQAALTGDRGHADIDEHLNSLLEQRGDKLVDRAPLIAETHKLRRCVEHALSIA